MTTFQRSIQGSKEVLRRWAFAWLAVVALLLASVATFAADAPLLLTYQMNAVHQGSALKVFADGNLEHSEWTCCPRIEWDVSEPRLSVEELARVRNLGSRAVSGVERTHEVMSTVGLLMSGALRVIPAMGAPEVTLYSLQRSEYEGWRYRETERTSPATEALFAWLHAYVRGRAPYHLKEHLARPEPLPERCRSPFAQHPQRQKFSP